MWLLLIDVIGRRCPLRRVALCYPDAEATYIRRPLRPQEHKRRWAPGGEMLSRIYATIPGVSSDTVALSAASKAALYNCCRASLGCRNWTAGDNCGVDGRPGDPWMTLISCITLPAHGYPAKTGCELAGSQRQKCTTRLSGHPRPTKPVESSHIPRGSRTLEGARRRARINAGTRRPQAGRNAIPHMRLANTLNRLSFLRLMI